MSDAALERIDKWLWFARFVKTRGLAQKLIDRGQVSVNEQVVQKAGATVKAGDRVAVVLGPIRRNVLVLDCGERRGPADEARALYDEPHAPERLAPEDAALPLYKPSH